MSKRFFVQALVTTNGAEAVSQGDLEADFTARIGRLADSATMLDKIKTIYGASAVDRRHMEFSPQELDRRRESTSARPIVNDALLSLGKRALERLFAQGHSVREVDALIVVASNFDGFPGLSRRLCEALDFRADALFYDLSGLACGGANHGINLAHLLLETGQCKKVCVLAMDVLGTFMQLRRYATVPTASEVVARVLSSDGAAAMLFGVEQAAGGLFSYGSRDFRVHAWPRSVDYAQTRTDADGEPFGSIAKEIRTRLLEEAPALLDGDVLTPVFIHPGGVALVRDLMGAFPQLRSSGEMSLEVLEENGNLSSPTVLYVLARAIATGVSIEPNLRIFAFGPGIYTTVFRFEEVRRA